MQARENSVRQTPRIQAACMSEKMLSDESRACMLPVCARFVGQHFRSCMLPVCARYVGHYFLAHACRLYARDLSDNIFSRMHASCMREICRTLFSCACMLLVCARFVGKH